MPKFCVEMAVGYCASVEVESDCIENAVKEARELVLENPSEYLEGNVEIEGINYVSESK